MTSILTDHDVAALRATPGTRSSSISTMRGPRCRRTARWTRSARTCCARPNAPDGSRRGRARGDRTARALAARLFNAQPDEIALTGGNSPGWGSAFAAFATAHPWRPGDRILVGRHEWGGNLACMRLIAERAGARGNHSVRPGRLRRSRGAARHAGRTRAPDRADLAARQRRPDQSRRRDRRGGARTRHRLFRGRGPGRGPIAHRRGAGRLRRAGRRRTQGAARPARHRPAACGAISCPG